MTDIYGVAYIHNFYGISNETKFVKLEDYQKLKEENAEMKSHIEKMKNCWNCSHHDDSSDMCGVGCHDKDKWELAE